MPAADHECDLFLLSSHRAYSAENALAQFAKLGARNVDGWGIGRYTDGVAKVLRSERPALDAADARANLSREFAVAVEVVSSPVLLGHLRLASTGAPRKVNNHPFKLNFLGYDWLLVHNGTAHRHEDLSPRDQWLLAESDSDTPRVFEFLRRGIIEYHQGRHTRSLIEACRAAYLQLLEADSGKFNLILSNGYLSFAFIHWRPFYLLRRTKGPGDAVLLSTLKLTDNEEWMTFEKRSDRKAKMLVFSGPTLVLNGDIPA